MQLADFLAMTLQLFDNFAIISSGWCAARQFCAYGLVISQLAARVLKRVKLLDCRRKLNKIKIKKLIKIVDKIIAQGEN
jgi:hypothetical protein